MEPSHGRTMLGPDKDPDLDQELDNNSGLFSNPILTLISSPTDKNVYSKKGVGSGNI